MRSSHKFWCKKYFDMQKSDCPNIIEIKYFSP